MSQSEVSESAEDGEGDDFVSVMAATGRTVRLTCSQVSWVEAEHQGHFMRLHTVTGESYRLYGTLKSLEQQWAKYGLIRIHKSFLVSLPSVRKLRREAEGPVIDLDCGAGVETLPVSRRKFQDIKKRLKLKE